MYSRKHFIYIDDFGRKVAVALNDYIGEAGGLTTHPSHDPSVMPDYVGLQKRHVRVRSLSPQEHGKKVYKDIPVNVTSPLWTGNIGQRLVVDNIPMEVIDKLEEREHGRKGAATERKALKKIKPSE